MDLEKTKASLEKRGFTVQIFDTCEQAADYLRTFLPIPEGCEPLCVIAFGYSDFRPAPLPATDDEARIIRM